MKIFKKFVAMSAAVMMMAVTCMNSSAANKSASGSVICDGTEYKTYAKVECERWNASSETYINGPYCTSISTAITYKYLDTVNGYKYVKDHAEKHTGGGNVIAKASMPAACIGNYLLYNSVSASSTHGVTWGTSWSKSLSVNY